MPILNRNMVLVLKLKNFCKINHIHASFLLMINKENVQVMIGKSNCAIQSLTITEITCILGASSSGSYSVLVQTANAGLSNNDILFQYDLNVDSLSDIQGKS